MNFFENLVVGIYLPFWIICLAIAVVLAILRRDEIGYFDLDYWKYIAQPWKVVMFFIAGAGVTILAPHSGDPTWDYVDSIVMSVLTYTTAPWSVGIIYRWYKKKASFTQVYVAVCIAMLSASWFYDLYMYFVLGFYPPTWWSNIPLSLGMYVLAGFMWNLIKHPKDGIEFGFSYDDWFQQSSSFKDVFVYVLLFSFLVAAELLFFIFFMMH